MYHFIFLGSIKTFKLFVHSCLSAYTFYSFPDVQFETDLYETCQAWVSQ